MKSKRELFYLGVALIAILCTGCCSHNWLAATCTSPKVCSECGKTEGEAIGHVWQEATCTEAKTCSVCGITEGEAIGHTWQEATCTEPEICSVCGMTEGKAVGHTWVEATCTKAKACSMCGLTEGELAEHTWESATCTKPKTCSICGETEGDALGHTWIEATCTEPKTCYVCKDTEGESLSHEMDSNNVCVQCRQYFGTGLLLDFHESKVGSSVFFGSYDQDVEWKNGKEEIEWIVLDKQEDKLLVISKYFLDRQPFNNILKAEEINWETSFIREWLNDAFLSTAFSDAERGVILETTINDSDCGNLTVNKIFLLSKDEYLKYEKTIKDKVSIKGTQIYYEESIHGKTDWLLRSVEEGTNGKFLSSVKPMPHSSDLELRTDSLNSTGIYCIRPAMWIPAVMELQNEEEETKEIDPAKQASLSQLKYGDRFTFGTYELDATYSNGGEDLEWYVLDRQDDKILAICVYGFDSKCDVLSVAYDLSTNYGKHDSNKEVSLRKDWVEYRFYQDAFTAAEKNLILPDTDGKYAFMLTKREYDAYFSHSKEIPVGAILWDGSFVPDGWALEDIDSGGVESTGRVWVDYNATWQTNKYVRPAIWIQTRVEQESTIKVGDEIALGNYEQDNDLENGKEAIYWKVVHIAGDRAFVVSSKVLDCQCYNIGEESIVEWKDCSLRTWLNNDFYEEAFTESEKAEIITTETGEAMTRKDNSVVIETYDNVFCLCYDEQKTYPVGRAEMTPYAEERGVIQSTGNNSNKYCLYWLRTNADGGDNIINSDGTSPGKTETNTPWVGVRPAMWIKLP